MQLFFTVMTSIVMFFIEWGELLQSSQHDIEQPHDSPPPVHTKGIYIATYV